MERLVGIDVGGTFTDFVYLEDGAVRLLKVPTTPEDQSLGILEGLHRLGVDAGAGVIHGTTVATNALLERRGARTALLTTAGFSDVLAIGRQHRPHLYQLNPDRPEPLVPTSWRFDIPERLDRSGTTILPLDEIAVRRAIVAMGDAGIESVAIVYLFSFLDDSHERRTAELIRSITPGLYVTRSSALLPEYREFERTSTTVVNAYVRPLVDRYLRRLSSALGGRSLRMMQSNGGTADAATAAEQAARLVLSGPAGGVVGAFAVAQHATGMDKPFLLTFDMGGTSTDVALCPGELPRSSDSHVADLPLRLPSIDIHTVGAGGGSIAYLDAGGALRVGPESAGAYPGPACYGRGGIRPTVTDAHLVLGRLHPDDFFEAIGLRLDVALARGAIRSVSEPLGLSVEQAALGMLRIADSTMERALRRVSVECGHDPRDYLLVPFGGAGPLHACALAESLGLHRILLPLNPGVLSALGLALAEPMNDASRALLQPADALRRDLSPMTSAIGELAQALVASQPDFARRGRIEAMLDLRYSGQSYELAVPLHLPVTAVAFDAAIDAFHDRHRQTFGYATSEAPVEAVAVRVNLTAPRFTFRWPTPAPATAGSAWVGLRSVTLGPTGATEIPVYDRSRLGAGASLEGPAVVTQYDTTTLILPGWRGNTDQKGHFWLNRNGEHRSNDA
jgi:N-methylhydantoinase A